MGSNSKLFNSIMSINKVIKIKTNRFILIETNTFNLVERKTLHTVIFVCLKHLKKNVVILGFEGKKKKKKEK